MPRFVVLAISISIVLHLVGTVSGQNWPRFRGPNGSGVAPDSNIPAVWSVDDYNWTAELPGVGNSSPVVWENRVFVTAGEEKTGRRSALCLHAEDGRVLWRRDFPSPPHRKHKLNTFASSTPAVDADHVYLCWTGPEEFLIAAVDHAGNEVWRRNLGVFKTGHGGGVSPIVLKEQNLVVVPGEHQSEGFLAALDRRTGEVRWRLPRNSGLHYATPCVFRSKNTSTNASIIETPQLIFTNWEQGFTAIQPETGDVLWQADVFDKKHIESSIGSPIVAGDLLIGVCGWLAVRQEVAAIRPISISGTKNRDSKNRGSKNSVSKNSPSLSKPAYVIDRGAPLCVTPLVKNGLLFLWSDEGIVTCADAATGQVLWRKRIGGTFYASPVCVGDRLYNVSAAGDVMVLAAAKEFRRLGRTPLGESSHSTPAIAHGVMYLRTASRLFSLGGTASRKTTP